MSGVFEKNKKEGGGESDPSVDINRSMPFSEDAEKGVLSCLIASPVEKAPFVAEMNLELFYHPAHRRLVEVIKEFVVEGIPVDLVALSNRFLDMGEMDKLGGPAFLAELYSFVPTTAHWDYYLGILKEKWILRKVINNCTRLISACYEYPAHDNARAMLLEGMAEFTEMAAEAEGKKSKRFVHIEEAVDFCVERTEKRVKDRGHVSDDAIATGFTDLDRRTMGFWPGELVIIGARPAMGKSALAMNITEAIAMANGHYEEFRQMAKGVGVVSLEMSRYDLAERMMVGRSGVNMGKIATGMFSRGDMRDYMNAGAQLRKAPIHFIDTGSLSVQQLLAVCRSDVERLGLKVLVVDYLQRMCSESRKAAQGRSIEIGEISSGLKQIAKDFGLVVIALAQVGRSAEDRAGCRPQLADLRESGDIEADADWVGLLYRPGYYAKKKGKGKTKKGKRESVFDEQGGDDDEAEDEITDDQAELIIAKARRGAVEPIELRWDGPRTQFSSTHNKLFSNNEDRRE